MIILGKIAMLLIIICFAITMFSPQIASWWVDQKWRRDPQDPRCQVCHRSWWRHSKKGPIIRCPRKASS